VVGAAVFALVYNALLINLKPEPYYVAQEIMKTGIFWWSLLVTSFICLGPRFMYYMSRDWFRPTGATYAREQYILQHRRYRRCCQPWWVCPCHERRGGTHRR